MSGSRYHHDRISAANPPPVCFNCGIVGHFVVACPQPSRETPAAFSATNVPGLPSASHITQYHQQNSDYPNQRGNENEALIQSIYNEATTVALPYGQPTFQSIPYRAPPLTGSSNYPAQDIVHHNYSYMPSSIQTYQAPISSFSPSNVTQNYQLTPSTVANPPLMGQWIVEIPSSSKNNIRRSSSLSGPARDQSVATNYRSQQPYRSASISSHRHGCSLLSHYQHKKSISDTTRQNKFGSSKSLYLYQKEQPHLQVSSHVTADSSQDSTKNNSSGIKAIKDNICDFKVNIGVPGCQGHDSMQLIKSEENSEGNVCDEEEKEDLWNWEYNSIFKDPQCAEIVALAQPLAASFKSTPVPLVQGWSKSVPSISRYARNDNAKEFVRSIRLSPQWSYMQEDPAFMDLNLDSLLIPLDEVLSWIAARYRISSDLDETYEYDRNVNERRKRERPNDLEDANEQSDNHSETICEDYGLVEPPVKKFKNGISGIQNLKENNLHAATTLSKKNDPCLQQLGETETSTDSVERERPTCRNLIGLESKQANCSSNDRKSSEQNLFLKQMPVQNSSCQNLSPNLTVFNQTDFCKPNYALEQKSLPHNSMKFPSNEDLLHRNYSFNHEPERLKYMTPNFHSIENQKNVQLNIPSHGEYPLLPSNIQNGSLAYNYGTGSSLPHRKSAFNLQNTMLHRESFFGANQHEPISKSICRSGSSHTNNHLKGAPKNGCSAPISIKSLGRSKFGTEEYGTKADQNEPPGKVSALNNKFSEQNRFDYKNVQLKFENYPLPDLKQQKTSPDKALDANGFKYSRHHNKSPNNQNLDLDKVNKRAAKGHESERIGALNSCLNKDPMSRIEKQGKDDSRIHQSLLTKNPDSINMVNDDFMSSDVDYDRVFDSLKSQTGAEISKHVSGRSKKESSKKMKRPQPKVEAAYSRRW